MSPVRHGVSPVSGERWLVSADMERVDAVSLLVSTTRRLGRDDREFVGGDSQPIRTDTPLIRADGRLIKTATLLICGDRKLRMHVRFGEVITLAVSTNYNCHERVGQAVCQAG